VRTLIGLTGQYAGVDEALTGVENLVLIARLLGLSRAAARARAAALLEQFGLSDAGGRAARTYSGGMRRRLDLAVSLVGRPRILFLDEPTTGLDPVSRNELWGMVRTLTDDGVTVLLTTQYLEEADQLADDIVVIDRGAVVATGTPDDLKARAGAAVLQMRPTAPEQVPIVTRVGGELAGAVPTVEQGTVSVPAGDETLMPAVVRRLDDVGVRLAELTLRRATLDEVFLALTGHRAVTEDTPADDLPADTKEAV
jgi:oleandomycin transport system ATP-binding protein